jgi:cell wall integrity and stress response component
VTASGSPTASTSSSGGPSKAGIAAGVVVGIVAISAIAGGVFLFIRFKRRREVEEEYRRNAAVSNFIAGGKPPTSSGGASSFTDTRLDPVMAQRRMSDGSIADNQDYSRRILKVCSATALIGHYTNNLQVTNA